MQLKYVWRKFCGEIRVCFFLGSELIFMISDQKELHSRKLPACSNVKTQLWFLTTLVFIQWSCTLVQIWNYTTSDHIGLHSMGLHGWSISLKSHKLFQTTLKYTYIKISILIRRKHMWRHTAAWIVIIPNDFYDSWIIIGALAKRQ